MAASEFDDIRPYEDGEVAETLRRLRLNSDFTQLIAGMVLPRINGFFPRLASFIVRLAIKYKFRAINSVRDFQQLVGINLEKLLLTASDGCTCSGIEQLKSGKAHLFISNHRDIAMDPALVDLVLERNGLETVRIAIGDNLLSKPYTSDLMRVNKSFIVKRSVEGRREKLQALKKLSKYIRHSIINDNESVWIAQREGRAKDGIDKTETALLKMLALSADKAQPFSDGMAQLSIVPVSISYELDPCDKDKGNELYAHIQEGSYEKLEHEDLASIYKGIVGYKGRIHIAFGQPVSPSIESVDELAAYIDSEVIKNYQAQPTNVLAYEALMGNDETSDYCRSLLEDRSWGVISQSFNERMAEIPEQYRAIVLAMYANPIKQKRDYGIPNNMSVPLTAETNIANGAN